MASGDGVRPTPGELAQQAADSSGAVPPSAQWEQPVEAPRQPPSETDKAKLHEIVDAWVVFGTGHGLPFTVGADAPVVTAEEQARHEALVEELSSELGVSTDQVLRSACERLEADAAHGGVLTSVVAWSASVGDAVVTAAREQAAGTPDRLRENLGRVWQDLCATEALDDLSSLPPLLAERRDNAMLWWARQYQQGGDPLAVIDGINDLDSGLREYLDRPA